MRILPQQMAQPPQALQLIHVQKPWIKTSQFSITVKECMFQKWTNWERVEKRWDSAEYHQHPTAHFKQKDIYWCCRGLPQPSLSLAPSTAITHKPSSSAHSGYHWLVNVKAGAWGLGSFSPACSIVSGPTLSTLASQEVMWRLTTERECWTAVNWDQICTADSDWWRKVKGERTVRGPYLKSQRSNSSSKLLHMACLDGR